MSSKPDILRLLSVGEIVLSIDISSDDGSLPELLLKLPVEIMSVFNGLLNVSGEYFSVATVSSVRSGTECTEAPLGDSAGVLSCSGSSISSSSSDFGSSLIAIWPFCPASGVLCFFKSGTSIVKKLYTGLINCCASGAIEADNGPRSIEGGRGDA